MAETHGGLEVVRHGSWGRPVLMCPSEAGSARDAERNGMLDAVRPLVEYPGCAMTLATGTPASRRRRSASSPSAVVATFDCT